MARLSESEINEQASELNDVIQQTDDRDVCEEMLIEQPAPVAVLRAVADLNHLDLGPTASARTVLRAILVERYDR